MADEDYELLPHEELERLRKEVEHLKKNPYSSSKTNKNLLDTMQDLNTSIKKLIKIFEGAQDEIIKEYSDASPTKILKEISEQNKKIAEGIVTVAKMVKGEDNNQKQQNHNYQRPYRQPQQNPQQPRPQTQQSPPNPTPNPQRPNTNVQPTAKPRLPQGKPDFNKDSNDDNEDKGGLFSKFRK